MSNSARARKTVGPRKKAIAAVPPPAPEAEPEQSAEPEQPQVRGVKPQAIIDALQGSLNEKANQIRSLEDRIVMLSAVIAEQDEEIDRLKKRADRHKTG